MKKSFFQIPAIIVMAAVLIGLFQMVNARKINSPGSWNGKPVIVDTFFPNDNQVCFYENENYGGDHICLNSTGEYVDLTRFNLSGSTKNWDNKISSVIIGKNACAIMYEHPNAGGYCLTLHGNGVNTRRISKLSPYNFNDKTSHIKSLAYPDNLPPEPYNDEVILFEHNNYDGYYVKLALNGLDVDNLAPWQMQDPITGALSYSWNDRISSVKLGATTCLTAWFNSNYSGQKTMYRANGSNGWNIPDLAPTGVGDKWSSLKVRDRDHCIQ